MQKIAHTSDSEQDPVAGRLRGLLASPFVLGAAEGAAVFLFGFAMAAVLVFVWLVAGGG